jgi:hypothetical protein
MGGAVALGLSVFLAVPAAHADQPGTTPVAKTTIFVPSGFDKTLSDTRASGHYELVADGLHIWTDSGPDVKSGDQKVAEYVDTHTPLATAAEPFLEYTDGGADLTDPGFQLVVDLDHDGTPDGILVGEPGSYGDRWWLSKPWSAVDLTSAPEAADGYAHSGPLEEWRAGYPSADVLAFGFSLGSGVHGDGTLHAIDFAGTRYTFAGGKDACKDGGWATSAAPAYKNQGQCVSDFAPTSDNDNGATGSTDSTGAASGTGATSGKGTGTGTGTSARATTGNSTGTSTGTSTVTGGTSTATALTTVAGTAAGRSTSSPLTAGSVARIRAI